MRSVLVKFCEMILALLALRNKQRVPATLAITALIAEMRLCDVSMERVAELLEFRFTRILEFFFDSSGIVGSISYEERRRHGGADLNGLVSFIEFCQF